MRKGQYNHKMSAVYLNAVTAIFATVLAFLILDSPYTWLLYYLLFTSIVTVVAFTFKNYLFKIQEPKFSGSEDKMSGQSRLTREMLLIFLVFAACLFLPIFLAGVLDPYIWFIVLVSFTSGISTSEVIVYLHRR